MKLEILSKDQLDAIDLKNAESNFIDALRDTAREQAQVTARQLVNWVEEHRSVDITQVTFNRKSVEPCVLITEKDWITLKEDLIHAGCLL